jgi:hypothetical protein
MNKKSGTATKPLNRVGLTPLQLVRNVCVDLGVFPPLHLVWNVCGSGRIPSSSPGEECVWIREDFLFFTW